jgi:hypothetical protein
MLRAKTPAIKPELVKILTTGWFIGWFVGMVAVVGSYFGMSYIDDSGSSEAVRTAIPILVFMALIVPRLFAPLGSAIGFFRWRRQALARLVTAGIQGATTTLSDHK